MKRIINILLLFILVVSLSVPVYAWSSEDWWSNVVSDSVVQGAPSTGTASHKQYIVLYDTSTNTYFYLTQTGTAYNVQFYVSASTGTITMTNNSYTTFNVYKYENEQWIQQTDSEGTKNLTSYSLPYGMFVSASDKAEIYIDNVQLEYANGELTVGGQVIKQITSVSFTGPSKTIYGVGDTFDASGITVIAHYSDGTSADVTSDSIITIPDTSVSGMNIEGKIEYDIWSYTFTINVNEIETIIPDEGNETEKSILEQIIGFFGDFWYYFKDTLRWIFVPDMDVLFNELKAKVDNTVGQVPLIGQVITIWKNVFNVENVQVLSVDDELLVDTGIDFNSQFYDDYTQQRINSTYINKLDLDDDILESDIPVSYVFSDPSQDITLHVPVPFHEGEYRDMVIPTSLYSQKLVNLDFLGIRIQSAQDLMFLFCEMFMWWNFILLLTKWALNFFSTNPFADFIQESNDKHELIMKEIEMEKENEEIEKEKQAMEDEKFPNPDAYRKKRDFELREARQEKKYLDYRMSQKKK